MYVSYYIGEKYLNQEFNTVKKETIEELKKYIKFIIPINIKFKSFFSKVIIPIAHFFELTNTIHLLKETKLITVKMWINADFTKEFSMFSNGNCMSNHKIHFINFRLMNRNLITVFHELFHLIDAIKDKYLVHLESKFFGYFHRPHERIANSLSIAIYDKLIWEYNNKVSLKTQMYIQSAINYNIKVNTYLTADLMDNYDNTLELLDLALKRIHKANRILTNNEITI